jgi:hypothetical protein
MINRELEVEEDVACPADDMKTTGCSEGETEGREKKGSGYELISISRGRGRPCRRRKAVETRRPHEARKTDAGDLASGPVMEELRHNCDQASVIGGFLPRRRRGSCNSCVSTLESPSGNGRRYCRLRAYLLYCTTPFPISRLYSLSPHCSLVSLSQYDTSLYN